MHDHHHGVANRKKKLHEKPFKDFKEWTTPTLSLNAKCFSEVITQMLCGNMLRTLLSECIPRCHDKTQPVEPVEVVGSETENKCDLTFINSNEWVAAARYEDQGI